MTGKLSYRNDPSRSVLNGGALLVRAINDLCQPSLRSSTVPDLLRIAVTLGAADFGGPLSQAERALLADVRTIPRPTEAELNSIREQAARGGDPLGEAFCQALSPAERRPLGAVYTPRAIVQSMVAWALSKDPARVIDPGAGSGRFAMEVARVNPAQEIVAVDLDPMATLLCRANLALVGAQNAVVIQEDYTQVKLPAITGRTAFIGNPPYVRHHDLSPVTKAWAKEAAGQLGLPISGLAGLHVLFFLATALNARKGDVGTFITSAEWLDVGYGKVLRKLLAGQLGLEALYLFDPKSAPFEDAMSTALISCFTVGQTAPTVRTRLLDSAEALGDLRETAAEISLDVIARAGRWTPLMRKTEAPAPPSDELVPLGSLVRVSRGVATGANGFFVMTSEEAESRGLTCVARPAITAAQEVFASPEVIKSSPERKVIIDLPGDIDLGEPAWEPVRRFVEEGEALGIHERYLCAHRKPWWRLGVGRAPRAVATYMARQAPAFALNPDGLILLNVAHGLYPKVELTEKELLVLVRFLNESRGSFRGAGRTYHGGLEKFEPKEMEALLVPSLPRLREAAAKE